MVENIAKVCIHYDNLNLIEFLWGYNFYNNNLIMFMKYIFLLFLLIFEIVQYSILSD